MTNKIDNSLHQSLIARLYAIYSTFFDQWRQVPLYQFPNFNANSTPIDPFANNNSQQQTGTGSGSLKDLVKEEESDSGDSSGGGGTMKGLRVEKGAPKLTRN